MQREIKDVYRVETNLSIEMGGGLLIIEHYESGVLSGSDEALVSFSNLLHRCVRAVEIDITPQINLPAKYWSNSIVVGEDSLRIHLREMLMAKIAYIDSEADEVAEDCLAILRSVTSTPGFNPSLN